MKGDIPLDYREMEEESYMQQDDIDEGKCGCHDAL